MIDCILFGAFERHNFGDMLMGLVFEHKLSQHDINVVYASILENDLTYFSGKKVYSIFKLLKAGIDSNILIIHVGGETLPCTILDAVIMDAPITLSPRAALLASHAVIDIMRVSRNYAYITPESETIGNKNVIWKNRIFYGLGFTKQISTLSQQDLLCKDFTSALIAGFRDDQSLQNARETGIKNAVFHPDIALATSEVLPFENILADEDYVLLHFNQDYLKKNKEVLIEQLQYAVLEYKVPLKIGVAGLARGHDSLDSIYSFAEAAELSGFKITVLPSGDIIDICRQISGAKAVISTSLHYRIVARSYGVPRISLDLHKLNCWAASNDSEHPYGVKPGELLEAFRRITDTPPSAIDMSDDISVIDDTVVKITEIALRNRGSLKNQYLNELKQAPRPPSQELWLAAMSTQLDINNSQEEIRSTYFASIKFLVKKILGIAATRQ